MALGAARNADPELLQASEESKQKVVSISKYNGLRVQNQKLFEEKQDLKAQVSLLERSFLDLSNKHEALEKSSMRERL